MAETLFYALALAAVGFAVGVISARSPMLSVLSLLGAFVCLALVYLLAGFQFLAGAQVLVYAGAIMVLFLFVVMLLNLADLSKVAEHPTRVLGVHRVALAGGSAALLGVLALLASRRIPDTAADTAMLARGFDELEPIAVALFSRYLLPFEAASLLLLATMVAVLVLAKRARAPQGPREQAQAVDAHGDARGDASDAARELEGAGLR
ncbi:MAG: NADH-quinone oxidoreductase subunit J [Planctomycetes bacterium]|nr:NADH-quinone oxidoreductase subunit J [Planctomycetota bacterium]